MTLDMHRRGSERGITWAELVVIVAVISTAAALMWPRLVRAPTRRISCINNLKQVGLAARIFASDHDDSFAWRVPTNQGGSLEFATGRDVFPHFRAFSNELNNPKILTCPDDRERIWIKPDRAGLISFDRLVDDNISYFISLLADESKPGSLLSGDRTLSQSKRTVRGNFVWTNLSQLQWSRGIHTHFGNVALSDGSVHQLTSERLRAHLQTNKITSLHLVIP